MAFVLSKRSKDNLRGIHPLLQKLVAQVCATTQLQFCITEGLRSPERQKELVAAGKSRTLKSRHITGHAFDFAPMPGGKVSWNWGDFLPLVEEFEATAKQLGIQITCGARWTSFPDAPHVELDPKKYPMPTKA